MISGQAAAVMSFQFGWSLKVAQEAEGRVIAAAGRMRHASLFLHCSSVSYRQGTGLFAPSITMLATAM